MQADYAYDSSFRANTKSNICACVRRVGLRLDAGSRCAVPRAGVRCVGGVVGDCATGEG